MLYYLIHLCVSALALLVTAYLVKGFAVRSFTSALFASFVIGVSNVLIRPLLLFLTFPINLLTLGLFTLVVDGVILALCAKIVPGFEIKGWASAIFGALILVVVSTLMHAVLV